MSSMNIEGLKPLQSRVGQGDETHCIKNGVLTLKPRRLGLGQDSVIGGPSGQPIEKIDLSLLTHPVSIDWAGHDSGTITDGADTIVFHGVNEIVLPLCMLFDDVPDIQRTG